jgi:hypothetical protein
MWQVGFGLRATTSVLVRVSDRQKRDGTRQKSKDEHPTTYLELQFTFSAISIPLVDANHEGVLGFFPEGFWLLVDVSQPGNVVGFSQRHQLEIKYPKKKKIKHEYKNLVERNRKGMTEHGRVDDQLSLISFYYVLYLSFISLSFYLAVLHFVLTVLVYSS